jgi:undecaprenyl-diphosphatase
MSPDEITLLTLHSTFSSVTSDALFHWFSSRSTFSLPILFALLLTAARRESWRGVLWWLALILVVGTADQFGNLLKSLFSELRPCASGSALSSLAQELTCGNESNGMPSNHALTFYAASLFVILTRPNWQGWHGVMLAAAFLSSLSRIYLGKHFPSQVVAGIFFGIDIGLLGAFIYRAQHWSPTLFHHLLSFMRLEPWSQDARRAPSTEEPITLTRKLLSHANQNR